MGITGLLQCRPGVHKRTIYTPLLNQLLFDQSVIWLLVSHEIEGTPIRQCRYITSGEEGSDEVYGRHRMRLRTVVFVPQEGPQLYNSGLYLLFARPQYLVPTVSLFVVELL